MSRYNEFDLSQLVRPLQEWFRSNARVLPWRAEPRAYYVWISEIMLQQTRVEAVKPYFDRFVRELPDVQALAGCPDDKLMKLWEGLGYYNRARNLKIAANQIVEDYDGVIPSTYEELLKLKGIGHYTAGAIASIAYGQAVPAVDGNVLRVISRVTADSRDIMKQSTKNAMEEVLFDMMNGVQDGECRLVPQIFNQALMELGATVCVPNGAPNCPECPWKGLCEARRQEKIGEIPVKSKTKSRRIEEKTVLIIKDGEELALCKRPDTGLLAGLYELPNMRGYLSEGEVLEWVQQQGLVPVRIQPLGNAKHIFSHIEWQMRGYVVFVAPRETSWEESLTDNFRDTGLFFVDVEETKRNYAIPSAFSQYANYLNLTLGKDAIQ